MMSRCVYWTREERGNAISKEKPSLLAGAAGGCGSGKFPAVADFVSPRTATAVTVGDVQARRFAGPPPRDPFGRIVRLRKSRTFCEVGFIMARRLASHNATPPRSVGRAGAAPAPDKNSGKGSGAWQGHPLMLSF